MVEPGNERITLGKGACSRRAEAGHRARARAYHLGEGRVLKTSGTVTSTWYRAYHLGEGRVLKTSLRAWANVR